MPEERRRKFMRRLDQFIAMYNEVECNGRIYLPIRDAYLDYDSETGKTAGFCYAINMASIEHNITAAYLLKFEFNEYSEDIETACDWTRAIDASLKGLYYSVEDRII